MTRSNRLAFIALTACMMFIFAIGHKSLARDIEETESKSFAVKRGQLFTLKSDLGSVEVTSWSQNELKVTVVKRADTNSKNRAMEIFEDLELTFDQNSDGVRVVARYHGSKSWWSVGRRLRLHFDIQVPREFNLDIRTEGGSIKVSDLAGNGELHTSGGSITVSHIDGSTLAKTSGGSIHIQQARGPVVAKTSGGSITIEEATGTVEARTSGGTITLNQIVGDTEAYTSGGSLNLKNLSGNIIASTSGGSIYAELNGPINQDCSLSTSGGSIRVFLPASSSIDLDAHTSGGRVETDLPITVRGVIKSNSIQGKINDGGPLLTLRTSGGSIYIKAMQSK